MLCLINNWKKTIKLYAILLNQNKDKNLTLAISDIQAIITWNHRHLSYKNKRNNRFKDRHYLGKVFKSHINKNKMYPNLKKVMVIFLPLNLKSLKNKQKIV